MKVAQKVAMNTGFLYGKMVITMFVSLYSVRLILKALGVEDYGIFALIGGVIGMLSFLNGAMTNATQRFFSFNLGSKDEKKLKDVFNISVIIHLVIGLLVVLILEIGGAFLFNGILNIPPERVASAKIVFHFMVVSAFFTINAVPYSAAINAHENMLLDSLVGIFESFMKLGIAIFLLRSNSDRLVMYGLLIASLTILVRFINSFYSIRNYKECRFEPRAMINVPLMKEMFSYAGWSLFGTLCFIARNQGLAFVLNLNFGIVINAAYGVANQVNGQLSAFSSNMYRALIPQIIKSEGGGDRQRMLKLTMLGCRVASLLMAFFAIPLIIEMPYVLKIWLSDVPEYTIVFAQLVLMLKLTQLLTSGLIPAFGAVGKIRAVRLTVGIVLILTLPLAILLIRLGLPAHFVLIGSIFIELIAGGLRIFYAGRIIGMSIVSFLKTVVVKLLIVYAISIAIAYLPSMLLDEGFSRLLSTIAISSLAILTTGWFVVFDEDEKNQILSLVKAVLVKLRIRKA